MLSTGKFPYLLASLMRGQSSGSDTGQRSAAQFCVLLKDLLASVELEFILRRPLHSLWCFLCVCALFCAASFIFFCKSIKIYSIYVLPS